LCVRTRIAEEVLLLCFSNVNKVEFEIVQAPLIAMRVDRMRPDLCNYLNNFDISDDLVEPNK